MKNYIALIGPKGNDLAEKCGYYGEMLVLKAQQLGLNTCWVALTFKKIPEAFVVEKGEKLVMVIAMGMMAFASCGGGGGEEASEPAEPAPRHRPLRRYRRLRPGLP